MENENFLLSFFSFAKPNFSFFKIHLILEFAAWWRQITLLYANIDYFNHNT